jgi:hypothetical protein
MGFKGGIPPALLLEFVPAMALESVFVCNVRLVPVLCTIKTASQAAAAMHAQLGSHQGLTKELEISSKRRAQQATGSVAAAATLQDVSEHISATASGAMPGRWKPVAASSGDVKAA